MGVGLVGIGDLISVELKGHDAGQHDDERDHQLDHRREHDALLPFGQAFRAQGPLGDELV